MFTCNTHLCLSRVNTHLVRCHFPPNPLTLRQTVRQVEHSYPSSETERSCSIYPNSNWIEFERLCSLFHYHRHTWTSPTLSATNEESRQSRWPDSNARISRSDRSFRFHVDCDTIWFAVDRSAAWKLPGRYRRDWLFVALNPWTPARLLGGFSSKLKASLANRHLHAHSIAYERWSDWKDERSIGTDWIYTCRRLRLRIAIGEWSVSTDTVWLAHCNPNNPRWNVGCAALNDGHWRREVTIGFRSTYDFSVDTPT